MKKIVLLFAICLFSVALSAQENIISATEEVSLTESQIDSSFYGINIFSLVSHSESDEGTVKISQSSDVLSGMDKHITANKSKKINGWRIRIYFDNNQNARSQSETIAKNFANEYPGVGVYRSHVSPYFKVTVGDFRTKYEAQRFSNTIKSKYPSVFLVRETITYPSL